MLPTKSAGLPNGASTRFDARRFGPHRGCVIDHAALIETSLGERPASVRALHGGCVAEVVRAEMPSGRTLAVKIDQAGSGSLRIEAAMLEALAERSTLPVPAVMHSDSSVLAMEFIANDGRRGADAERDAAAHLAALHAVGPRADEPRGYGFAFDTLIGPLAQPNPWTERWIAFFAEHRLGHHARLARDEGAIDASFACSIDRLIGKLDGLLVEPDAPSLVHGDCWAGNVLWHAGRVAAFIDPAVCHADAESELAFISLMGGMGEAFWRRYDELRPIADGYREIREPIYNTVPLLVHARLFGGGYAGQVAAVVRRFV